MIRASLFLILWKIDFLVCNYSRRTHTHTRTRASYTRSSDKAVEFYKTYTYTCTYLGTSYTRDNRGQPRRYRRYLSIVGWLVNKLLLREHIYIFSIFTNDSSLKTSQTLYSRYTIDSTTLPLRCTRCFIRYPIKYLLAFFTSGLSTIFH